MKSAAANFLGRKPKDPLEEIMRRVRGYKTQPMDYFAQVLGIRHVWRKPGDLARFSGQPAMWSMQEKLILACPQAIAERKPIYIGSGHSLGKDFISGGIALWFLQTYIPSIVVETAPTDRQVKDIMWKETLGHWERKLINLGGRAFEKPRLEIEKDWYLEGFTTKDTRGSAEAGGTKFQGFKGKNNICVIVTEAQGVEDNIRTQIDAITTSANVLMIFLGNPTRSTGWFAKGLRDKKKNIVFNFSCLENPNYIEKKVVIPGLADYRWVEQRREEWGEDDPRWLGRVLGKIPDGVLSVIFDHDLLEAMTARSGDFLKDEIKGVALDPAGEGMDANEFVAGGGDIEKRFSKAKLAPSDSARKAVEMCKAVGGCFIIVDCDGLGQRDFAELKKMPKVSTPEMPGLDGIKIIPFYGSEPSQARLVLPDGREKKLHGNLRCEAAFVTQQRAKDGKCSLHPGDREMREDLEQDEYFEKKGVLWLIPKDDIRQNIQRSPGKGDAYKMLQYALSLGIKDETTYKAPKPINRAEEFWKNVDQDRAKLQNDGGGENWTKVEI